MKIEEINSHRIVKRQSSWKKGALDRQSKPWMRESKKIAFVILQKMREDNISRAELAKALGTTEQYVGKLLKGEQNLTLETIHKIKEALSMDLIQVCMFKRKQQTKRVYVMDVKASLQSVKYWNNVTVSKHEFNVKQINSKRYEHA